MIAARRHSRKTTAGWMKKPTSLLIVSIWGRKRNTRWEQMFSGLVPKAEWRGIACGPVRANQRTPALQKNHVDPMG
jgi:hypothetical protein